MEQHFVFPPRISHCSNFLFHVIMYKRVYAFGGVDVLLLRF